MLHRAETHPELVALGVNVMTRVMLDAACLCDPPTLSGPARRPAPQPGPSQGQPLTDEIDAEPAAERDCVNDSDGLVLPRKSITRTGRSLALRSSVAGRRRLDGSFTGPGSLARRAAGV